MGKLFDCVDIYIECKNISNIVNFFSLTKKSIINFSFGKYLEVIDIDKQTELPDEVLQCHLLDREIFHKTSIFTAMQPLIYVH